MASPATDEFGGVAVANPPAQGNTPQTDEFGGVPVSEANAPAPQPDEFGGIPLDSPKAQYIQQQDAAQNEGGLDRIKDVAKDVLSGSWLKGLGQTAKAAVTTAPQLVMPTQAGTNARQDLLNAGLLNAADMSESAQIQAPRFLNMFTGGKETPEQLGSDFDKEQAYQKMRGNISSLGANPAISQQLAQNGGIGAALGAVSAPGTATVDPARQNALEPLADPTMYVPFGGAGEGLVRGTLGMLGRDALEQAPRAGLTATLVGKALQKTGSTMGSVAGWKDSLNSGLKAATEAVMGDPHLAEFAAHHGTSAIIGMAAHAMGGGELGAAGAFMAPQALKAGSDALQTAGKVLQEGEGTVPFFERMSQLAAQQGNNLAAKAYQLMDSSGAGAILSGTAKTAKNAIKAAAVTTPLQLPFAGNDPEQMANTIGANVAFGAAGGAAHELMPTSPHEFQARQDVDTALFRQNFGAPVDNFLQLRTQMALDRMKQNHPNIDTTSPRDQTIAAQNARQELGTVASIWRSNPNLNMTFTEGAGNTHDIVNGKSTINIDPTTEAMVPQAIAHEYMHNQQAAGQRGDVLNQLLGDPESKTPGVLRSYAPDGTPIDTPEFTQFRQNYFKELAASGRDVSFGGKQSEADNRAAEEFYAEALGSILGGHTNAGELNYARLRRSGAKDTILEKFFGKNNALKMNPLQMGFMKNPDGSPSGFNALEWLNQHPELKKTAFGFIRNKEYLSQMSDKKHEYDRSFENQTKPIDWIKNNPDEAWKQGYGSDATLKFSPPDAQGKRTFQGVRSPKEERAHVEAQARELFEKLKTDPKYMREVTDAAGRKSYQIIHLDDKILGSLTHLNEYQKDMLIKLNAAANGNPGQVMRTTYQPALKAGKRYKARESTVRAAVPYDITISQPEGGKGGANILTHILDIDQMLKNRKALLDMLQKAGMPTDLKLSDDEWFRQSLGKMAANHFAGKKATDGTGISDFERDFINATMGIIPKTDGAPREGINHLADNLAHKLGNFKMDSAVKQFRLDRINRMEHAPEYGAIPFQYVKSRVNFRPEETQKPTALSRPEDADEDNFYSHLSRTIDAKMPGKATSVQLRAMLKGNGVKDDEIKWSGLDDLLSKNNLVTKQGVQDFLKNEGGVKIQTTELGKTSDEGKAYREFIDNLLDDEESQNQGIDRAALRHQLEVQNPQEEFEQDSGEESATKYAQYQIPGGENYREQVFSLPSKKLGKNRYVIGRGESQQHVLLTPEEAEEYRKEGEKVQDLGPSDLMAAGQNYTSSHFSDIPNYLAHMRLNDRVDSDGKPGTLIEEMQSDRHQAGREKGYSVVEHEYQIKDNPSQGKWDVLDHEGNKLDSYQSREEAQRVVDASKKMTTGVPDAPMRKTWHEYLFRRALADAVKSGKDWIGWTTGVTQVDRYPNEMRRVIDSIKWSTSKNKRVVEASKDGKGVFKATLDKDGNISDSNHSDAVGKSLSEVIGKDMAAKVGAEPTGEIAGKDFTVGGEGMKGFYDRIVPQYVEKYAKKWGVKPELADIPLKEPPAKGLDEDGLWTVPSEGPDKAQIWKLPINDAMRESFEKVGQPLFRPEEKTGQDRTSGYAANREEGKGPRSQARNVMAGGQSQGDSGEQRGLKENDASGAIRGSSPQQFLSDFRANKAKGPKPRGSGSEEPRALLKFATDGGHLLSPSWESQNTRRPVEGGMEHEVYSLPEQSRVLKITKGKAWGLNAHDAEGYLERLDSLNRIAPGLESRVEGIVERKDSQGRSFPAIVTSMKQVQGVHPKADKLKSYLKEKGFTDMGGHRYQNADGLTIMDAHSKNFIERPDGTMVPIDIYFLLGDVKGPSFRPDENESDVKTPPLRSDLPKSYLPNKPDNLLSNKGALPIRKNVQGSPFKIGQKVKIDASQGDRYVFDNDYTGRVGIVKYLEYSCGCGQTFPNDPMIGVEIAGKLARDEERTPEFWPEHLQSE